MENVSSYLQTALTIYFAVGLTSGLILLIDKYFMIQRYPLLASSCMYDLLLKDTVKKIELSNISKRKAKKILVEKFSLENKKAVRAHIDEYFSNDKVKDYSQILSALKYDESYDEKSESILKRFRDMKEIATSQYRFEEYDFQNVNNVLAYEYANIGYIIKLSLRAGYISEKKAVLYLRSLIKLVETDYEDWLEFASAFLVGKTIKSTDIDVELIYIMDFLTFDRRSLWAKVPMHS